MLSTKPTMRQSVRRFASAPRAALLHGRHALDRTRRDVSGEWIDAEEERGDEDEQADPAAPDQDRTADAASPPCVLDLRRIEARAVVESHARSPCTSGARGRLGLSRLRLLFREQPRQRLGHRTDERRVLLARQLRLGKKAEGRAERRALRAVADVAVLVLPRDERAAATLGQLEERAAVSVPALAELGRLDRLG